MSREDASGVTVLVAVNEAAWVEGLRARNSEIFDQVYAHFAPRLFSFLVRLTKDRTLAEDLLQETWLRVARKAKDLAPDTQLAPWLFTVARNLFISHRRWAALDLERIARLKPLPGEASVLTGDNPFEHVAAHQLHRRMEAALAALSVKDREVLLLVAVERMSPTEAAGVLKVPPATLRQRLKRARDRVASRMEALPVAALEKHP